MKDQDIEALVRALAPVIRDYVAKALEPFAPRIAALEAVSVTRDDVRQEAADVIGLSVLDAVGRAVAALPVPQDGKDGAPGRDGIDGKDGADGKPGEKGDPGADGKDGERGEPGVDGKDGVDGKPGEKGADGLHGKDGAPGRDGVDGKDGKDGVGLAGALKDHEGSLVLTLTDGTVVKLGRVDGEPGKDGAPGRDVDPEFVRAAVRDEVQRQVTAPLADAYKGVWKPAAYKRGEVVTWGGSLFIASADTEAKPETNDDWKLAVKRGRDGKDGRDLGPPPKATVKL